MSAATALYYPHTVIRQEGMLKSALLLWDTLEYISPFLEFRPEQSGHFNSQWCEACELAVRPLVPLVEQKKAAHDAILELATNSELPSWFLFDPEKISDSYFIYAQKLLPDTWQALQELGLAGLDRVGRHADYTVTPQFGLTIMAILADCCAGTQRDPVTDRVEAYSSLQRWIALTKGSDGSRARRDFPRLVSLSVPQLDPNAFALDDLIRLRRREAAQGGHFLRELRRRYRNYIDRYVTDIATAARSAQDVNELERVFQQEMADDVSALRDELHLAKDRVIFSKEMVATVILAAGVMVEPLFASVLSAASLGKVLVDYEASKNKALSDHATGYLYYAQILRERESNLFRRWFPSFL